MESLSVVLIGVTDDWKGSGSRHKGRNWVHRDHFRTTLFKTAVLS